VFWKLWSALPAEDGAKTAKQKREKTHVLCHGNKNHDKNESSGDVPVRQVSTPEHVEQKQMNRNERCHEKGEQPASRKDAAVIHQGFVPFVKIRFPTPTVGASART